MIPDPLEEPTIDIERAGELFGLGRSKAYVEARRYLDTGGAEGMPVIRFGRTLRAPTARVLELLGLDRTPTQTDEACAHDARADDARTSRDSRRARHPHREPSPDARTGHRDLR